MDKPCAPTAKESLGGFIVWIALSFAAASPGARFTGGEWYQHLAKPGWMPPGAAFGIVWAILYATMGVAAWLVWRAGKFPGAPGALSIFLLQLLLNMLWPLLFFALHRPGLAFIELIALWLGILATMISFWPKSKAAALLLFPYLAWVGFAGALNFAIWRLNT